MPDAIAIGELLIDFVPTVSGVTLIEAPAFIKAPGGAPANVAVGLARLGVSSGFLGQVGDEAFGHFLAQTLRDNGVDVSHLKYSSAARTMLAFVSLHADGEREFMFYRHPSADMLYHPEDVDPEYVRTARILHFGSISLIGEPSRSATLRAISIALAAGALISFDPNLRLDLWSDAEAAREGIRIGWPLAHVVKIGEEELRFIANADDTAEAARAVWHPGLRLMIVTGGARGSRYITPTFAGDVAGFKVEPVDTTGAGDGFVAGLLKGLLDHPDAFGDEAQLRAICRYANAVGALTTTRRGAIPALPTANQVDEFLRHAR
ncbi:MAG TPA: PfkB family carbohydrate kinase [Anaerolineae bacterium]|nr:PfkB family carbohydrate kinase [Anaerolineae bacterium]